MAVVALSIIAMVFLFKKLEYFQPYVLKALPTMMRKKLLNYLPVADILLLESAKVFHDLDMNVIWKDLFMEKHLNLQFMETSKHLEQEIRNSDGSWRHLYLKVVFKQGLKQLSRSTAKTKVISMQAFGRDVLVEAECSKILMLNLLFGIDPDTICSESFHNMYQVYCPSCNVNKAIIPHRYLLHYTERNGKGLLDLLSIFWTYGRFYPQHLEIFHCADVHGLAAEVMKKYPKVLSLPLKKVRAIELVPKFTNKIEYYVLASLLSSLSCETLQTMKLIISSTFPGTLIRTELLGFRILELIVKGDHHMSEGDVFLERVIYNMNRLQSLSLESIPLSDHSNEEFIASILALFSKRHLKRLCLCDAEISVDVMNSIFERFLSSKFKQELELKTMRIYHFSNSASMLSISPAAIHTGKKSLTLNKMSESGFLSAGLHILDALKALPLLKLTVTIDIIEMLRHCEVLPVKEFALILDRFDHNSSKCLPQVISKKGVEKFTLEIPLDLWIYHIHSQNGQQSRKALENVIAAMEIAANDRRLSKLVFYSESRASEFLGSKNPLSYPEGTLSLIFKRVFSLPNLQMLTVDISHIESFIAILTHLIVNAWSAEAKGRKLATLVISPPDSQQQIKTEIRQMCEVLKLQFVV